MILKRFSSVGRAVAAGCISGPFLALLGGSLLAIAACAQQPPEPESGHEPPPRATVTFKQPEGFVDFRTHAAGRDEGRPQMIAELRQYLNERAELYLPADQRIEITFTDIDLAGRLLPIRGSGQFQRLIEDFYPPRLWFTYRVLDAGGHLVAQGEAALVDFSFLRLTSRAMAHQTRSLPYEKALLDNWWREQFRGQ